MHFSPPNILPAHSASGTISSSQLQPNARRKRMTVVTIRLISPASIFCNVRGFKSARSASCSWVRLRDTRARRKLRPNTAIFRAISSGSTTTHHARISH